MDSFKIKTRFLMNDGNGGCIHDFHEPVRASIRSDDNGQYNNGEDHGFPEPYVKSLSMHGALNDSYRISMKKSV